MMEMKYLLLLAAVVSVQAAIPQLAASEVHIPPLLLLYTYQPSSCTNCHEYTSQFELLQQLPNAKEYQLGQLNCLIWAKYCFTLPKKAPAIFLFAGGEPLVYEGEVEAQLIDAWVNGVIESGIAKLSKAEVEKKKGKENFVLVGGLDINEKVKLATIRSTRYLNLPFYQIETDKPVFKLYLSSRGQDEINYKVPLDAFLVGFQIFHRTRPYLIPLNVPQYLSYFHNQVDSEQIMIFVDHKDTFSTTALSYLKSYCYKQLATVICFTIQKDSPILGELPGKELLSENNSSLLFLKQKKQIGYLYPSKVLNYDKLTQFIEQAKNNSIKANFDNTPDKVIPFKYDHAIKLTSRNYKSTINTNPIVIVKFYAPGCGYCKKLAPGYDEAAKYFKQQGSEVVVATVDADQEVAIADQQKIEKYPTLKVFINGQAIEYTGKYSGQGIIEYLLGIETAKLAIIQSLDQITRPGLVISGIDENSNLHRLPGLFTSLPIYWLKNEQALRVNIYNKDDSVKKFTGKVKLAAVLNWLSEETEPVLVNLGNSEMSRKLTKAISQKKPILGLINKGVHSIEAVSQFLSGYCEKKKDFICGVATKGEDDYQHLAQWLNVPATEDNYLFWIDLYKTKSYLFSKKLEALNTDNLDAFVKGIKKGSVKENVRSNQKQEEKNGQTQLESKQSEKVQVQSVQSKQGTETQGEEL